MGLIKPAAASITASFIFTHAAFAATITTTAAVQVTESGTEIASFSNSNLNDGSSASAGPIEAQVNADGTAQVFGGGFFASGQNPLQLIGTGTYEIEETNTSGASQDYAFDFLLSGLIFDLNGDFGGAGSGPNPFGSNDVNTVGARFSYNVLLDGTSIFTAAAEMFGGNGNYQTANVVNATVNNVGPDGLFGSDTSGARFEVADIFDTLDLGSFADGETFTVTAIYEVEMLVNGFENVVGANFFDPANLSLGAISATTTSQPPVSPVPLPAAGWMLLAGVGGIAAMKRRKKV